MMEREVIVPGASRLTVSSSRDGSVVDSRSPLGDRGVCGGGGVLSLF